MSENTMQTNSLYTKIEDLLKSIPELVTEEKELRYNKIKEMAENGDSILLIPLMQNAEIKNAFFSPILDSFVFKTKEFKEFLDYSSSNNSYSQYLGKKIGLYCGDSALTDRNEVVLNFPFKDCVLEGGQKKEDGLDSYFEYDKETDDYITKESKRREVFFNETLAKDEIDNLFSPKAFCNVKKFTSEGESPCVDFTRDAEINKNRGLSEDTITDNLIIKGNNLLALHSLKKEFEGKIKLIYIDPPYNTGSDGFSYNDNFNHSTWLTFMKNRLEVARDLLRDDGCIFVQIDNSPSDLKDSPEFAYLGVLLDMVFKRNNYITTFTWKKKGNASNTQDGIGTITESIFLYSKNINFVDLNLQEYKRIYRYEDEKGEYNLEIPVKTNDGEYERKTMQYCITVPEGNFYPPEGKRWTVGEETIKQIISEKKYKVVDNVFKIKKYSSDYKKGDNTLYNNLLLEHGSLKSAKTEIEKLGFKREDFSSPKPEILIRRLLEIASNSSDIVLDYHLGSGTTAAVAHKMNRQYIGVEQMDYIKTISCERLKKVIEGEQGGISKSVDWQGGGSFVYMELAEKNEKAMQLISACKNYDELVSIFNTLSTKYFLHYNVRINDFINKTCKEEQFKNLSLEKQKEIFCRMLDLNQLYVNYDDRNDKDSGLSENDIKATENFYQIKKDGE